jgi:hypothetical protein
MQDPVAESFFCQSCLPVLELTPASFACGNGDGGRPTEMLHAPCSMLHAPRSKLRQSIFLPPYIPTRTLVTASSLLLPAFVPFCVSCPRRPQQLQPSCTVRHTCTRTVLRTDRQPSSVLVFCGFARSRGPGARIPPPPVQQLRLAYPLFNLLLSTSPIFIHSYFDLTAGRRTQYSTTRTSTRARGHIQMHATPPLQPS